MINLNKPSTATIQRFMQKSIPLLIILLLSLSCFAQKELPRDTYWEGPATDTIPVELANGSMIITLKIDKRPYRFIFDTGAPLSISGNLFKRKGYDSLGSQIIRDATGNISSSKNVLIPELKLGKFTIRNAAADVLNYQKSSFFNCLDIDGLIGGAIFKNSAIRIDLKNNRLIISSQPEYRIAKNNEIPVDFDDQYNPFFTITLKDHYPLNVLFDTGAEDLLTIPGNIFEESSHVCGYRILRKGSYSLAGAHNISVKDDYKIALLDSLQFGKASLLFPEISVVDRTDISILGVEILRYGIVQLDYRNSLISFSPYPGDMKFIGKDNFPGFSIGRENRIYVINGIESGSDADLCGMAIGMQVTKVANIDLTTYSRNKDCRILRKNLSMLKKFTIEYLDHSRRKKTCTFIKAEITPIGSRSGD